jgi:uncharacterized repeat protein (TIGR03803 family)
VRDAQGNLYGTTSNGGVNGWGTVFEVDATGKETVLHLFKGSDGYGPNGGLVLDAQGNLYGTTFAGGVHYGTVFKLDTTLMKTVLYSFTGNGGDGEYPVAGLVRDFTAVPHGTLGYLTVWPSDQTQPVVSTLNAPTGQVTANAAIVPAALNNGDISAFVTNDSDLVIDVNGYFAPAGSGGLSLYPMSPCRVSDTRNTSGAFSGELTVDVAGSPCAVPLTAQAYVVNATVVPPALLGYLSLWTDGQMQPLVSTLNSLDGSVTSNMAIVPTTNGSIDAFTTNPTDLILDISSYFAP